MDTVHMQMIFLILFFLSLCTGLLFPFLSFFLSSFSLVFFLLPFVLDRHLNLTTKPLPHPTTKKKKPKQLGPIVDQPQDQNTNNSKELITP